MEATPTTLCDVLLLTPRLFSDERGVFMESYNREKITSLTGREFSVQDNQSTSKKGVFRGLHFQTPPFAQSKLVRVLSGAIYDVIVDIRKDSPTYGKSQGFLLDAVNHNQLFVPAGYAHGFLVLEDNSTVLYKVDNTYSKEHEGGLTPFDPDLNITLPLPINEIIINDRDRNFPTLREFSIQNPFFYTAPQPALATLHDRLIAQ